MEVFLYKHIPNKKFENRPIWGAELRGLIALFLVIYDIINEDNIMNKKILLISIIVIVVAIVVVIALEFINLKPNLNLVSEDGKVVLTIPKDALPKNVSLDDIVINKIEGAGFSELEKSLNPIAVYRLEPEGLEFEEPLEIKITVNTEGIIFPTMMNISKGSIEETENTQTEKSSENEVVVTAYTKHFSDFVIIDSFLGLEMSANLGEYFVGQSFTVPVVIHKQEEYTYNEEITYYLENDPSIQFGYFKVHNDPVIEPIEIRDKPSYQTTITSNSLELEAEFTCMKEGSSFIWYEASIYFDFSFGGLLGLLNNTSRGDLLSLRRQGLVRCKQKPLELDFWHEDENVITNCGGSVNIDVWLDGETIDIETVEIEISDYPSYDNQRIIEPSFASAYNDHFSFYTELDPGEYYYRFFVINSDGEEKDFVGSSFTIMPCSDLDTELSDDSLPEDELPLPEDPVEIPSFEEPVTPPAKDGSSTSIRVRFLCDIKSQEEYGGYISYLQEASIVIMDDVFAPGGEKIYSAGELYQEYSVSPYCPETDSWHKCRDIENNNQEVNSVDFIKTYSFPDGFKWGNETVFAEDFDEMVNWKHECP